VDGINSIFRKFYKGLQYVSCFMLVALMTLLLANILCRAIFRAPIFGTFEGVSYMSMFVVIFALSFNESQDGNVTVTLALEYLKPKTRNALEIVGGLFSLAMAVFITYDSFLLIQSKYAKGDLTNNLFIPQWIFVAALTVGFFLLSVCLFLKVATKISVHKRIGNITRYDEEARVSPESPQNTDGGAI
jgi:TRAP-type C4-dicarboxylate transport system permease small subunit